MPFLKNALRTGNNASEEKTMSLPTSVRIVEVGPRDGLQNEKSVISNDTKIEFINLLSNSGLKTIEAGSFVNPKWVPQMAGSEAVFTGMTRKSGVSYAALTPNIQGFERALNAQVSEVAIFAAASESFSQKNLNCSIDESLRRFDTIMQAASNANIPVRGYVSCVAGCPYQGEIDAQTVKSLSEQLLSMGCYEVSLGDTTGVATPGQTANLIETLTRSIAVDKLAVHMHDTRGQALANVYAALQQGVSVVDSSVAGLGGCPYASQGDKVAAGNVSSEDLVYMLNGLGIEHGVDLQKLIEAGNYICNAIGRANGSKVAAAMVCV